MTNTARALFLSSMQMQVCPLILLTADRFNINKASTAKVKLFLSPSPLPLDLPDHRHVEAIVIKLEAVINTN